MFNIQSILVMDIKKPLVISQPEVGELIRELRNLLGLTQEKFAANFTPVPIPKGYNDTPNNLEALVDLALTKWLHKIQ